MPTGYTSKLYEGNQSFEAFVWDCARAFGALILMRDDPADKPVPEKLEAPSFYETQLQSTRQELAEWQGSSPVARRAMYEAQQLANEREAEKSRAKARAVVERYRSMRALVQEWRPPSEEHTGLRKFMLEQLDSSIEHDSWEYNPEPLPTFEVWQKEHEGRLHKQIGRYVEETQKERERNESRQRWVDQLRASVPQPNGAGQ